MIVDIETQKHIHAKGVNLYTVTLEEKNTLTVFKNIKEIKSDINVVDKIVLIPDRGETNHGGFYETKHINIDTVYREFKSLKIEDETNGVITIYRMVPIFDCIPHYRIYDRRSESKASYKTTEFNFY